MTTMGKTPFVDDNFVKSGATLIDVGINRVDSLSRIREIYGEDPKRLADYAKKGYSWSEMFIPERYFQNALF